MTDTRLTPSKAIHTIVAFWRSLNWPLFWKTVRLTAVCIVILVFFRASAPPPGDLTTGAAALARDSLFNYVGWELDALTHKLFTALFDVQPYLDETTRAGLVRDYMGDLSALYRMESQIADIYADPNVTDPDAASADLRAARDAARADLQDRQGMIEGIIEEQISAVLVDQGLAVLGQVLPPVAIRFTPLPDVLIISPRDEIRVEASISLNALTTDRRNALESAVDADFDVSSLVVDIGGMALYPSMVGESDALVWTIETSAHEWVHHYLFFYPLGMNYFDNGNPETRTINETTAEVLGKEIGRMVLQRYYPDLVPPDTPPQADAAAPTPPPDPNAFNFSTEMNTTRVTVDAMLAGGDVDGAEAYMEQRREFFRDHGYVLRKINQAFFAFYGGYQGEDNLGTAGDDPIGPAIAAIRTHTGSAADFLRIMRGITTRDQLFAARDSLEASGGS